MSQMRNYLLKTLTHPKCNGCGGSKQRGKSFCGSCFAMLPMNYSETYIDASARATPRPMIPL